eukprot:SAG31_NODE_3618_length_4063_cov_2.665237_1_plen_24_part_10
MGKLAQQVVAAGGGGAVDEPAPRR